MPSDPSGNTYILKGLGGLVDERSGVETKSVNNSILKPPGPDKLLGTDSKN
jgi:hypothetical protein